MEAAGEFRQKGETWGRAGEIVSATVVVLLAAGALLFLVTTLEAGRQPLAGPGASEPRRAERAAPMAQPSGIHVVIVTSGDVRAGEIALLLAKETEIRELLGEPPRDAQVIGAVNPVEAEAIATAINDQTTIPGVAPMAAVVVR